MHNFDQVRVQIQGEFAFAADGVMKPGTIGYFPEGTPYGPQTSQEDTVQLVLQIGGPSGSGYLSEAQRIAAVESLAAKGEFREGRYFANDGTRKMGVDGFQAAWEQAMGRKMVYPPMRLQRPMLIQPDGMSWLAVSGMQGVEQKTVWSFGPRTVSVVLYRLQPGSRLLLDGPVSCFVEDGAGGGNEAAQNARFAFRDTLHASDGERLTLESDAVTHLIVFLHPVH